MEELSHTLFAVAQPWRTKDIQANTHHDTALIVKVAIVVHWFQGNKLEKVDHPDRHRSLRKLL